MTEGREEVVEGEAEEVSTQWSLDLKNNEK